MPTPADPPKLPISSTVFNALKPCTWDSATGAFDDGAGSLYYLFVDVDTNGTARWTYSTDGAYANVRAKATQLTGNVITGGSYQQSGAIRYQSVDYFLRLERDSNGNAVANAHT